MDNNKYIYIKGARVHNLKNIELSIAHNQLVVITGLSGSGKSTLAFDTIFAEGQRRYVESLSSYARQFLGRINKPDVDLISGIAPAIAIQQKVITRNPRSTIGTSTEIYDYLKLLFARIGRTISPVSGVEVSAHSVDDVTNYVMALADQTIFYITSPIKLIDNQGVIEKITLLLGEGFQRLYYRGESVFIDEILPKIKEYEVDDLKILITKGRVSDDPDLSGRVSDAVATAFNYGDGECTVITDHNEEFSNKFEQDGIRFERPSENLFSFNTPLGACLRCEGYGKITGIDEDLVVPDKNKSIYDDAIAAWRGDTMKAWKEELIRAAEVSDIPIHRPFHELTRTQKSLIWRGNEHFKGLDTFFKYLEGERYKIQYRVMLSRYTGKTTCPDCGGSRLRPEALYVKLGGVSIAEIVAMSVNDLTTFFANLQLTEHQQTIAKRLLVEINNRLQYLLDVGLGYLTLDRLSSTLSGGESQRINLARSLGSSLVGSLYILDEPSIGLHPRDTHRLIGVLKQLRDLGNTVIVVEHEEQVIRAADTIIDIGPGAGYEGGEVVFNGTSDELIKAKNSLTADYLTGKEKIERLSPIRHSTKYIELKAVRENNLKGVDIKFPLGVITCVTGVSGSGKSSLVKGILYPALRRVLYDIGSKPGNFGGISGDTNLIKQVEMVDQNPIGKSSRSNPVTYIKAYDEIRKLFADQQAAKQLGLTPSHFSFNIAGGRCEECEGEGVIKIEMQFMADVELLCEACGGRRFKDDILEVKYHGKSIADVLDMTVDSATEFFGARKNTTAQRVVEKLKTLQDVGLGYIRLGQSSSTLSGGESQRVKLASFLLKENSSQPILFIFDEPTTGLHFHDIRKLLRSFDALMTKGHSIIIVEHNPDVIRSADWVIDLGPEGGDEGGYVLFEGTPEELKKSTKGYTGKFL